jgi:hypothetical protein
MRPSPSSGLRGSLRDSRTVVKSDGSCFMSQHPLVTPDGTAWTSARSIARFGCGLVAGDFARAASNPPTVASCSSSADSACSRPRPPPSPPTRDHPRSGVSPATAMTSRVVRSAPPPTKYPIVVGPPCVASKMAGLRRPRLLAALSGSLSSSARIPGRDLGGRRFVSAGDRRHAFGHFWTAHTLDKLLSNNGGGESENENAAAARHRPRRDRAGVTRG